MSIRALLKPREPIARLNGSVCREALPLPGGDTLLLTDAALARLDPQGQVKWSKHGEFGSSRPQFGPQGELYVAEVSRVARLEAETGEPVWTYDPRLEHHSHDLALGPGGEVYTSTDKSRALRLNSETGEPEAEFCVARTWVGQWLNRYGVDVSTAPDGAVVVQEAFQVACREPDGRHRWRHRFAECVNRPVYCRDRWLFSDNHGKLTALSPKNGAVLWDTSDFVKNGGNMLSDSVTPGPEGIVYFHPRANSLMALDETSGRVLASFGGNFPNPDHNFAIYRPVLGEDGRLYVSRSDQEELHVLDPRTLQPVESALQARGLSPRMLPDQGWLLSRESTGTLRLDSLHADAIPLEQEPGASRVAESERHIVVGGIPLPRR